MKRRKCTHIKAINQIQKPLTACVMWMQYLLQFTLCLYWCRFSVYTRAVLPAPIRLILFSLWNGYNAVLLLLYFFSQLFVLSWMKKKSNIYIYIWWKSRSKVQYSPLIFSRCFGKRIGRCLGFWAWGRMAKECRWMFILRCARRPELSTRCDLTRAPEVNTGQTAVLFSTTTGTDKPGAENKD